MDYFIVLCDLNKNLNLVQNIFTYRAAKTIFHASLHYPKRQIN
jgi:hypothetical protein